MTKVQILQQTTETELFLKVLGLSEFPTKNIKSPFSSDSNPSFKLYKNGTFKDFSAGYQGDVWQLVAYLHNLDCKSQFDEVLKLVAEHYLTIQTPILTKQDSIQPSHEVEVFTKDFERFHYDYWLKFGVDKLILDKFGVKALDKFTYQKDGKPATLKCFKQTIGFVFFCNSKPCIYIPQQLGFKKKLVLSKWSSNAIWQFPDTKAQFLIICAGQKDCLTLNAQGFHALTFKSEVITPNEIQIKQLKSLNIPLYVLYDNDKTGTEQAQKVASLLDAKVIRLPHNYNDVAEFAMADLRAFCAFMFEAIKTPIEIKEPKQEPEQEAEGSTIFHITENYLSKHYDLRYNTCKLEFECKLKKSTEWQGLNENSLYVELQKKSINVSIDRLIAILKSDFVTKFNPFTSYFNGLKWDGKSHIDELGSHILCGDMSFKYHFKKWLVRAVKCATIPNYFNKQALILVHDKQNSGKSTFCRFLCPPALSDHIAEDFTIDKDARIMLAKNFLINLDELSTLSKHDVNVLKTYFSKDQINERLPYDRKNSILQRVSSFIGSTNMDEFLNDETGSVRWLCFKIAGINFDYKKTIDINQVWAEATHLAKSDFECEFTAKDVADNEARNKDFAVQSNEFVFCNKYIAEPTTTDAGLFVSASDILVHIQLFVGQNLRLNTINIGKAMKSLGYARHKRNGLAGYQVRLLDYHEANEGRVLTNEQLFGKR